jgi:hypothetical protein
MMNAKKPSTNDSKIKANTTISINSTTTNMHAKSRQSDDSIKLSRHSSCGSDSNLSATDNDRDDGADNETLHTERLVKNETNAVLKLRIGVIFVLIACTTAVAATIHHLTRNSEEKAFKIQYEAASDKVLNAFADVLRVHAGA